MPLAGAPGEFGAGWTEARLAPAAALGMLPNVGLQLFDVVMVTDARAGISLETYRVRGI